MLNTHINSQTIKIVIIVIKKINETHRKIKNEGLGKAFFQDLVYLHLTQELKLVRVSQARKKGKRKKDFSKVLRQERAWCV